MIELVEDHKGIPVGSIPVRISKANLLTLDTLHNSYGEAYISNQSMFDHIWKKLDNDKMGIKWELASVEVSNKVVIDINDEDAALFDKNLQRTAVRKVLVKFRSSVEFEGKILTFLYSCHYKESTLELAYALGFDVKVCTNGNILADHWVKKAGRNMEPQHLDVFLDSWILNYDNSVQKFNEFTEKLENSFLSAHEVDRFIGTMLQDVVAKPQKITDLNVLTAAIMKMNNREPNHNFFPRKKDGSTTLWHIYNHFTDALRNEELASRFKKHGNIASYFEQKCTEFV